MDNGRAVRWQQEAAVRQARERLDSAFDVRRVSDWGWDNLDAERRSRSLQAMVVADCTAVHPTESYKSVLEFRNLSVPLNVVLGGFLQHGNASHTLTGLLRAGHKRPDRGRAAERGQESSPSDVDRHRG